MEPEQLTITSQDRIERIISRICENMLQVTVKKLDGGNVVVKGRAVKYFHRGDVSGIRISQISAKGLDYLSMATEVQVEFSMMATKVAFVSLVMIREPSGIILALPYKLVSIERRKNARFLTTPELGGFIVPRDFTCDRFDTASPPIFSPFKEIDGFMKIVDVSIGGMSAMTVFPRVPAEIKKGMREMEVTVYLPTQKPENIKLDVRWTKKITESDVSSQGKTNSVAAYRYGFEFMEKRVDLVAWVGSYIQLLNHADAI